MNHSCMKSFCEIYILSSLTKEPIRYKNLYNPSCIGLILPKKTLQFSTFLYDFYNMTVTDLKIIYGKTIRKLLTIETTKIYVMINFDTFVSRNCLQKISIQTAVDLLALVRKNTQVEII